MKTCKLTKTESEILALLEQNRGQVVDARTIYEQVWGQKYLPSAQNTVTVHVLHLRRKLGKSVALRTVWGKGYTLD